MTDFDAMCQAIDRDLPSLARTVIERHQNMSDPLTHEFLASPDGREQHQIQWHQWGIITHTRIFLRHHRVDVPSYLRSWGLWEVVRDTLNAPINGVSRWDLLCVSILLHDIGKFAARTRYRDQFHFAHHERLSGKIIREEIELSRYGLTLAQIEYIALTAQDHFVLGLARKAARGRGTYDRDYAKSGTFRDIAREIQHQHPEDYIEVGILFLGDSLAKVDPHEGPEKAISQYDINIAVARTYLEVVLLTP
ncbi:MAG: hypothetical protein PVSMB7_03750 [Chloroflexota bacterium]